MTRMWRRAASPALLLLVAVGTAGAAGVAGAQDDGIVEGPRITLDRSVVRPGDRLVVTLAEWTGREVTLSVCGNGAARSSMDCNLLASQGVPLNRDGSPTVATFSVAAPALPCPCVVRASSSRNEAVALAPIELVGHPAGSVIEPVASVPLRVGVQVRRADGGLLSRLRSALAGPTAFDVTVRVTNHSADTLSNIVVAGTAGRGSDDVADIELPAVGSLAPGASWVYTARATVPAPVLGRVDFAVTASGAGPSVHAEQAAGSAPVGLVGMAVVLGADLAAIGWRRAARRRARRAMAGSDGPEVFTLSPS
ncbi:MAG: hypothetical protein ABL966_02045 [Acidimicrobiales bacterium]